MRLPRDKRESTYSFACMTKGGVCIRCRGSGGVCVCVLAVGGWVWRVINILYPWKSTDNTLYPFYIFHAISLFLYIFFKYP